MRTNSSSPLPASLTAIAIVAVLLGTLGGWATTRPGSAQVQVDGQAFALAARLCPEGYEGAAYAEDCAEPISGFTFDVAGPVNTEATTGDDGRVAIAAAQPGLFTIEALVFDRDVGFVVLCERPIGDYALPVDIEYSDAGFEVDLEEELNREIPAALDPEDGVTCTWYSVPGVPAADPDERPGIVQALGVECPDTGDAEEAPTIAAVPPGEDAAGLEPLLTDCNPAEVTITLENADTQEETQVETADEPSVMAAHVEAGVYTATQGDADPSAEFGVDPGETTLLVAATTVEGLQATLRPGPTAEPAPPTAEPDPPTAAPEPPTAAPEPLATIQFGPGDWQDAFPNINTGVYDRAAVAVYGQFSPFPTASLRFELPSAPAAGATLTVEGLADELGPAQITITVNGVEVYRGDSGFPSWNPSASTPAWTPVSYSIPAGVLRAGANQITVANLAQSDAFGLPPYVLLSVATLSFAS